MEKVITSGDTPLAAAHTSIENRQGGGAVRRGEIWGRVLDYMIIIYCGVRRTPHLVEDLHGFLPVPGAAARVHSSMEGHGGWGGGTALLRQTQVQHRQRSLPLTLLTQRAHHLKRGPEIGT